MTKTMLRIKNFHLKQFLGVLYEIQINLYVDTVSVCPYACVLVSADELLIKSSCVYRASVMIKTLYYPTDAQISCLSACMPVS